MNDCGDTFTPAEEERLIEISKELLGRQSPPPDQTHCPPALLGRHTQHFYTERGSRGRSIRSLSGSRPAVRRARNALEVTRSARVHIGVFARRRPKPDGSGKAAIDDHSDSGKERQRV